MTAHVRIRVAAAVLLAVACGERKEAPAAPPPAPPSASREGPPPSPPAQAVGEGRAPSAAPPAATPAAPSTPAAPPPAPPPPAATPAATSAPAARPAPPPAAPASPASAHAKVGADKCKGCHRLQYDSWAASPHAAKGLDCEGCHGNGAGYRSPSIMRDRDRAAAAGLVTPALSACRRCHGAKADAALYAKVHAHRAR